MSVYLGVLFGLAWLAAVRRERWLVVLVSCVTAYYAAKWWIS